MSSPILPTTDLAPTNGGWLAPASADELNAFLSELSEPAGTPPDARRFAPPPELLGQIADAGVAERELRARGARVRFCTQPGRRTRIELWDGERQAVRELSVSAAVELACGKPLG